MDSSTITRDSAERDAEAWRLVAVKTSGMAAAWPYALVALGFGYVLACDGAHTAMAVEQGLRDDAGHSLVALVRAVLTAAINPVTWQRFSA